MSLLAQADTGQANFGPGLQADSPLSQGASDNTQVLGNLEMIISNLIGFLTVIAGLFFLFYFLIAAINWVTAGGDSGKVQKARDQMVQGVMGLVVVIISYAVVGLIGSVVGIDILNPATTLGNLVPTPGGN
jgi:vacuolar-type H+-ATPase subunit I/STV1